VKGGTWEHNGDCEQDHNMAAGGGQLVQQLEHLIVGALGYDLLLGALCMQQTCGYKKVKTTPFGVNFMRSQFIIPGCPGINMWVWLVA